jgi:hypothetical protein
VMAGQKESFTDDIEKVHVLVKPANQTLNEGAVSWEKLNSLELSNKEQEYLYILGHHLYLINEMIDGGRANFALAHKVFGYAAAEAEASHRLGIDVTTPMSQSDFVNVNQEVSGYREIRDTREIIALRKRDKLENTFSIAELGLYRIAKQMTFQAARAPVIQEAKSFELTEWELTIMALQYEEKMLDTDFVTAMGKRHVWSRLFTLMSDHFTQGIMPNAYILAAGELNKLARGRNYEQRWKLGTEGLTKLFYPDLSDELVGPESANVKSVKSFLEKAVRDPKIFTEAGKWAVKLGGQGDTSIQTDLLEHPKHYLAAIRERLNAIDALAVIDTAPVGEFMNQLKLKMADTVDVVRSRIVIPDGQLDNFCEKHILALNPEVYLISNKREKAILEKGTKVEREEFKLSEIQEGSIEQFINGQMEQADKDGYELFFAAVHDNRKIGRVPCQVEIATVTETRKNIEARGFYRGWQ